MKPRPALLHPCSLGQQQTVPQQPVGFSEHFPVAQHPLPEQAHSASWLQHPTALRQESEAGQQQFSAQHEDAPILHLPEAQHPLPGQAHTAPSPQQGTGTGA